MNSCQRQYHHARKELQSLRAARPHPQSAPQPEQSTATSESPGSFYTYPENTAAAAPKPAPQPPARPVRAAETSTREATAAADAPCQAGFAQF
jgi:hypothetical protein